MPVPKQFVGASGCDPFPFANRRDVAACALMNPDIFSFPLVGRGFYTATVRLNTSEGTKSCCLRSTASMQQTIFPGNSQRGAVPISPLQFSGVGQGEFMRLAGRQSLAASISTRWICLFLCLEIGISITLSAERFSSPHKPQ